MKRTYPKTKTICVCLISLMMFLTTSYAQSQQVQPPTDSEPAIAAGNQTAWGFTPFPPDFTPEAIKKTYQIVTEHGNLYAIHRDDGIPWQEALENKPFPKKVQDSWNDFARHRPEGKAVYLGLAPLGADRTHLIHASEGSSTPQSLLQKDLDSTVIKQAYLNYVLRAIETFHPDYLNLGIEAGELAARKPSRWPQFVNLYQHVANHIKKKYPTIQIGISFGLQTLMEPDVSTQVKGLVDDSDYIGISFYPFMSQFHEKFGAAPLPAPPAQWYEPLRWLKQYTNKPVAICETGYSSTAVTVEAHGLHMPGSETAQKAYIKDLGAIAQRDNYLFVTWFLPIDYDKLGKKMPVGDGAHLIWEHIGFFDAQMREKPAWNTWLNIVSESHPAHSSTPAVVSPVTKPEQRGNLQIGFDHTRQLFLGSSHDHLAIDSNGPKTDHASMSWSFNYKKGRFQWITKQIEPGLLHNKQTAEFWIKSDRPGTILFQLEESNSEAFFSIVKLETQWQRITLPLNQLQVDPSKRQNGQLQLDRVSRILLADATAISDGAQGARKIWLSNWAFH